MPRTLSTLPLPSTCASRPACGPTCPAIRLQSVHTSRCAGTGDRPTKARRYASSAWSPAAASLCSACAKSTNATSRAAKSRTIACTQSSFCKPCASLCSNVRLAARNDEASLLPKKCSIEGPPSVDSEDGSSAGTAGSFRSIPLQVAVRTQGSSFHDLSVCDVMFQPGSSTRPRGGTWPCSACEVPRSLSKWGGISSGRFDFKILISDKCK